MVLCNIRMMMVVVGRMMESKQIHTTIAAYFDMCGAALAMTRAMIRYCGTVLHRCIYPHRHTSVPVPPPWHAILHRSSFQHTQIQQITL